MASKNPSKGAKTPNAAQQAAIADLATSREGYIWHRICWEGKTVCMGVAFEGKDGGQSVTRMYRITPDGKAVGV